MRRLFVFAIGGTGSRVLKSLTMLLACGIKPADGADYEIVPIIIDPHQSNEDLSRTVRLLGNYQSIVRDVGTENGFFSMRITTLDRLVNSQNRLTGNFTFNLNQVANTRFKDYIGFNELDTANKALCDILFSGTSINKRREIVDLLDIEMDIGFVGNPNIGSVVLNQVKDSEEFREFASNFNANDRIFIISSIFGGTGAAGFPAILKNIRDARNNTAIDSKGFLQDAKIGALTVLPYFNIEKDEGSPIQKSDFISKSKSALSYYKDNVNSSVNALYYIADEYTGKAYKNDPGEGGQRNDAHFIELASALAILNFMEIDDKELATENGIAIKTIFKEFGIRRAEDVLKLSNFEDDTERQISLRLSQFYLFRKFLAEHLDASVEKQAWSNDAPLIDRKFLNGTFFRSNISEFVRAFEEWLLEMSTNKRSFSPFNFKSSVDSFIADRHPKKGIFVKTVDYNYFDDALSRKAQKKSYSSAPQKLIKLFFDATEEILTAKFGLKS